MGIRIDTMANHSKAANRLGDDRNVGQAGGRYVN
jgi:hypothetical protein